MCVCLLNEGMMLGVLVKGGYVDACVCEMRV